jgi:N-acetylglutamate synthase-like GNAT family acetyltransferase
MIVKHAKPEDAQRVCELANILKIKQNDKSQSGFLIYPLNESGYNIRTKSKYFYIAEDNSKIDGFLMCYDSNTLNNYLKDGLLSHEDGLVGFVAKQTQPFVFGDQIGVNPDNKRKNLGTEMMNELFKNMKKNNIFTMYVGILHKPTKNITSISFCNKIGFKEIAEVTNEDKTVWGIYKLELI